MDTKKYSALLQSFSTIKKRRQILVLQTTISSLLLPSSTYVCEKSHRIMFSNDQLRERWQVGECRELKASPFKVSFLQFFFFSFSFNNFSSFFHILFFMALAMQCDVKTWQALESGDADATATTMFQLEKLKKRNNFFTSSSSSSRLCFSYSIKSFRNFFSRLSILLLRLLIFISAGLLRWDDGNQCSENKSLKFWIKNFSFFYLKCSSTATTICWEEEEGGKRPVRNLWEFFFLKLFSSFFLTPIRRGPCAATAATGGALSLSYSLTNTHFPSLSLSFLVQPLNLVSQSPAAYKKGGKMTFTRFGFFQVFSLLLTFSRFFRTLARKSKKKFKIF